MKKELEIVCIYRSGQGREAYYHSIVVGNESLDLEDYEAENFWQTMGGLEITKDGYKTIFHSTDFYHIVKPINFLLHSLYKIKGISCNWFDAEEANPKQITLQTVTNDILKLVLLENNELSLSFFPLTEITEKRGRHYFINEVINIENWIVEAETALNEYFEILSRIIKNETENKTVKIMKEYLSIYQNICINHNN